MSKPKPIIQTKQIQAQIQWMRIQAEYSKMTNQQIQDENKRVLQALKNLQSKLDRQLQQQKVSILSNHSKEHEADHYKVACENIKNNQNFIKVIEREVKKLRERREELKEGLESKLNVRKYQLEKKLGEYKGDIKKMKQEQNQINKRLATRDNPKQPEFLTENTRLEQQLRVYSIKYVKLLQKHNKITQQLALASNTAQPQLHIPEQIYDKQLQERQQAQYKQYQGIVKLCTILSKRNDSQTNKFTRIYNQKLKQLQKMIINLGQVDRMISLRQGEIIQGKKNLELVKFKVNNNEKMGLQQFLSMSQSSLRRNSYSTSRLPLQNKYMRDKQFSQGEMISRKLSKIN